MPAAQPRPRTTPEATSARQERANVVWRGTSYRCAGGAAVGVGFVTSVALYASRAVL